ncbi:hypothetical protein Scep_029897 [Stephania cephalantha]|uniref:Uncharacterized protein n=1 Tax=Stephania cephalantha TaxID=152367 RepID=A0AAP0DYL3_9MAGN
MCYAVGRIGDKLTCGSFPLVNSSIERHSQPVYGLDLRSRFAEFVEIILIPYIIVPIIHNNQQNVIWLLEEIQQIDFEISGLKDLETQFIQYNVRLQNMTDEEELCSTQPIFNPEEDVSVDTLKIFKVNEVTQMEDYLRETSEEFGEAADRERGRPTCGVGATTHLPCTLGTPYKGVEVKERSQIFYTADTLCWTILMRQIPVLEVPNELLNLKEGVQASLPKYVDGPFVVDISKREGIM